MAPIQAYIFIMRWFLFIVYLCAVPLTSELIGRISCGETVNATVELNFAVGSFDYEFQMQSSPVTFSTCNTPLACYLDYQYFQGTYWKSYYGFDSCNPTIDKFPSGCTACNVNVGGVKNAILTIDGTPGTYYRIALYFLDSNPVTTYYDISMKCGAIATTTLESTTSEPTTSEPTTSQPTTSETTTLEPTTSEPTTSEPTTSEPTTSEPTTLEPTTSEATTTEPTTSTPITYISTTSFQTTSWYSSQLQTELPSSNLGETVTSIALNDMEVSNNNERLMTTTGTHVAVTSAKSNKSISISISTAIIIGVFLIVVVIVICVVFGVKYFNLKKAKESQHLASSIGDHTNINATNETETTFQSAHAVNGEQRGEASICDDLHEIEPGQVQELHVEEQPIDPANDEIVVGDDEVITPGEMQ